MPEDRNTDRCNVLMVYPRFVNGSFWNYRATCELVGARYPAPPLGMITVAAMLPKEWTVRLVDRNIEDVTDGDFAWADLVMTGGMLPQQYDTLAVMELAREHGKPCAVGGPDATQSPHLYQSSDFRVLGEAESVIDDFIAAWRAGLREGTFEAPKFQADVTKSPTPRYELLKHRYYGEIGMQFSRGCPFNCEFCDIIELYGRRPRTKTTEQMLLELQKLYDVGYRGFIELVDDNLIGNKKLVKAFLPALVEWQEAHNFPFEFSTQASVNLADDADLLGLMKRAGFGIVFLGVESPEEEVLVGMQKKQNTHRNLVENVHRIYKSGIFVVAGMIVGFDHERHSVADPIADFIEAAAIPFPTIGLLFALPNTQLTRRLRMEGRLHQNADVDPREDAAGLNFETKRDRREILTDFRDILERLYLPEAYCARVYRVATMLDMSGPSGRVSRSRLLGDLRKFVLVLWNLTLKYPDFRGLFWRTLMAVARKNPRAIKPALTMLAFYVHLGPFTRSLVSKTERDIELLQSSKPYAKPLETLIAPAR
jgi:radical SAM superfamily enzyme YgiQ (UPF0313 family)